MGLFRNTADLKLYVDIHGKTDWSTLKLYVDQAENDYIIPLVSAEQLLVFSDLINSAPNATKTFEQIFEGSAWYLECFHLIARSLANYALYEALPFINTAVGDIGVMQQQSKEGTATAAPQWRYESRRAAHLNVGDSYADKLLMYLEKHKDVFTNWASSPSFTISKDLFIGDSIKLSEYLGTGNSRRAYLALKPYIRLAEKQVIMHTIGKELFEEIKAQMITNPSTVSILNKNLLGMIEEVVAWSAYYNALPFISIKITGDGVQVISRNDGVNNRNAASKDEKQEARAQAGRLMDSSLATLQKYMDDNVEHYLLYKKSRESYYGPTPYRRIKNRKNSGYFAV